MMNAGFTDYLTKPVVISEVEDALLTYLPAEKVILKDEESEGEECSTDGLPPELLEISLLDAAQGMAFCGGAEEYMDALAIYEASILPKAEEIERLVKDGDWAGYTIAVHSLKSTSRSVGAISISEEAQALEKAGNDGDAAAIRRETPRLLEQYRSLAEPLHKLLHTAGTAGDGAEAKEPIAEGEVDEAFRTINAFCAMYDDTSIGMVLDMLEEREIPESRRESCQRLREAYRGVDWERMEAITGAGQS